MSFLDVLYDLCVIVLRRTDGGVAAPAIAKTSLLLIDQPNRDLGRLELARTTEQSCLGAPRRRPRRSVVSSRIGDARRLRVTQYIAKQIDIQVSLGKNQRLIAKEIGYGKPNMISMFKRGEARIPFGKIPALAKSLNVDPAYMFRLAI